MTCIATDGKSMAADGRACIDQLITTDARTKIARTPDGGLVGLAGDASASALVREWFAKGADLSCIPSLKPGEDPGTTFEALILRPDGTVEMMDWNFTPVRQDVPAAIGSGRQVAIGAMLAGASPEEAIKITAQRVTSVGGKTVVEHLESAQ